MRASELRLSRPVYEGLPWLYVVGGLAALGASYLAASTLVSAALGLPGFAALLAGVVVWLRRRGYRRMRLRYARPDALSDAARDAGPWPLVERRRAARSPGRAGGSRHSSDSAG